MNKKAFLTNLENFLKTTTRKQLYTDVSEASKQIIEEDIKEFIKKSAGKYTLQELRETFTSGQITLGLFLEYRDAKIFTSDDLQAKKGSCRAATWPVMERANTVESILSRPQDWCEPVTGMLFVCVQGGCFQMGCGEWDDEGPADEKPVHEVCLDGFWIGKFAVTVAQYMKFVKETESHYPHWLEKGSKFNITTGNDDYYKNSGSTPQPVGTKIPNGLGIYNMSGNVSEWCLDLYSRFAYSKHQRKNPVNLDAGSCRVVRGGSWNYGARDVRCTDRSIFLPNVRTNDLGFRLVKLRDL